MRLILCGPMVFAVAVVLGQTALAQSLRSVGGPAEMPPASFQGQQYVDSRGCVFMRAGLSGRVSWVPRIGNDRKPLCNEVTPAQAQARLADPQPGLAPPAVQNVGKPMATVASNLAPQRQLGIQRTMLVPGMTAGQGAKAAPGVMTAPGAAPKLVPATPRAVAAQTGNVSCPAGAPVLEKLPLRSGGTVLVCSRGQGGAGGYVQPRFQVISGPGEAIQTGRGQQVAFSGNTASNRAQHLTAPRGQVALSSPDQTYIPAWKDGRLNPMRGQGTAEGWNAQDQVWTRQTPARAVSETSGAQMRQKANAAAAAPRLSQSTRSVPVAGAARYVQVGTFGDPRNVSNAGAKLSAMGLPVAKSRLTKAGRELVIVLAGPFASASDAQSALVAARRAGFGDAFVR